MKKVNEGKRPFFFLKKVPEKNLRAYPPKGVSWRPRNGLVAYKKNQMKKPNKEKKT